MDLRVEDSFTIQRGIPLLLLALTVANTIWHCLVLSDSSACAEEINSSSLHNYHKFEWI